MLWRLNARWLVPSSVPLLSKANIISATASARRKPECWSNGRSGALFQRLSACEAVTGFKSSSLCCVWSFLPLSRLGTRYSTVWGTATSSPAATGMASSTEALGRVVRPRENCSTYLPMACRHRSPHQRCCMYQASSRYKISTIVDGSSRVMFALQRCDRHLQYSNPVRRSSTTTTSCIHLIYCVYV